MFSFLSLLLYSGPSYQTVFRGVNDISAVYYGNTLFPYVQPTRAPDFGDQAFLESYKRSISSTRDSDTFVLYGIAACTLIGFFKILLESAPDYLKQEREECYSDSPVKIIQEEKHKSFVSLKENEIELYLPSKDENMSHHRAESWSDIVDDELDDEKFVCNEKNEVSLIGSSLVLKNYTELPISEKSVMSCSLFGKDNWY